MSTIDLFSKRQKALKGEISDVFIYDKIPRELKVQIILIWREIFIEIAKAFKSCHGGSLINLYQWIVEDLRKEYGEFQLIKTSNSMIADDFKNELEQYILQEEDTEKFLNVVEYGFRLIHNISTDINFKDGFTAIEELNDRFKEHSIGYEFVEKKIIKIDSLLLHVETVKPVLKLLHKKQFQGVEQEFLNAYDHYKMKRNKEALNDCLKSFESLMKTICEKRGWSYDPNDSAKKLINVCLKNGLIPFYWQQQLLSLHSLLESSIPTGRNKSGGHGQGSKHVLVPDYLVTYMLHMTASTLLFLISAEEKYQEKKI